MKIERINENQIRCTLSSLDLSDRNMNLGELAYGSEKARGLFHEMIQKAYMEVGFDVEDIPLMVEAIPMSNESVMLVITKVEDTEELDSRFSRFSPAGEDEDLYSNGFPGEYLEGAEQLMELLAATMELGAHGEAGQTPPEKEPEPAVRVFSFQDLDECILAAKGVGQPYDGRSRLYKRQDGSAYYLTVTDDSPTKQAFHRVCNILSEYGLKQKSEYAREAYFDEHLETIIKEQAIGALARL
ncbi:MAG: adaptor protein MecA [Lachnospiraceae bacterium]|jgi:adapter protein MecA 1/2|nr:adaptor protein MecA [Lachnospiraceae bacterium]